MPGIDFRQVRQRCSMAEVLDLIGFVPRLRYGAQVRGCCPVHRSEAPTSRSFAVHLQRQLYHCFRCGSAGNQLDLYAAVTQQGLYAAAVDLCVKLHREVPRLPAKASRNTSRENVP
jgi:DNA primase